jgi:hypothetical protein
VILAVRAIPAAGATACVIADASERHRVCGAAVKVDEAPSIDGLLDEACGSSAAPLGQFIQAEPFTGMPGSERTEVGCSTTTIAIYVG